jgi:hypothetical protein
MNRPTLTEDALLALRRMKHDLYAVGEVANGFGSVYDCAVLRLILRNAAVGAGRAFGADGAQRDAAWKHVVLLVDELLRHRLQFPASADKAELDRLRAFVSENADAFEPYQLSAVTRSVAV